MPSLWAQLFCNKILRSKHKRRQVERRTELGSRGLDAAESKYMKDGEDGLKTPERIEEQSVSEIKVLKVGAYQAHLDVAATQSPSLHSSLATIELPARSFSASQRSHLDSEASSSASYLLKDQLYNARIEAHNRAHSFFVPRPVLEELISVPAVTDAIVSRVIDFDVSEATLLAEEVCKCGRRLFATLVAINKVADIDLLLKEGITDEDLPFVRKPDSRRRFALYRKGGQVIKTFESWRDQDLEQFDRSQWWMMAPIFRLNEGLQILDDNIILPFVPLGSLGEKLEHKQGGYSEVYPVRVHPAHHTFWAVNGRPEDEPLVAVKRLFSSDQMEFLKEAAILTSLSSNHHPHLIKLLATYKHEGRYHFMFPYANANLRTYWDDRPSPTFDRDTVLWSLRQMTGIANGLLRIHSFSDAVPLQADSETDMTRGPRGTELIARHGEAMFGRHGDLKPENLLWFRQDHESQDPKGILQIADFGLGRFHRRDSRSGINPETVQSSPTYEPPECKLRQPVSRAYDIWSLGCVFLEFMTWLLEGTEQIEGFSEFRGRVETNTGIDDDNFFTIVKGADGAHAVLREGVITWKDRLHTNENCSQLIHDLLDLTMSQLLVIDARKRCTSAWLLQQLRMYLQRAEHDEEYMLRPAPHAPFLRGDDLAPLSTNVSTPRLRSTNNTTNSNSSNGWTGLSSRTVTNHNLPKDLVLRISGTPGLHPRLNRQPTWPTYSDRTLAVRKVR